MLLTDNRIKVNTQDMDGWTALMWACEYKFVDVVKSLLEKGADPHLRDRVSCFLVYLVYQIKGLIPILETGLVAF